jgi:hypothetical protein
VGFSVTAYAIVRTRVKAGHSREVYDRLRAIQGGLSTRKGLRRAALVDLGAQRHCTILEWDSIADLRNARTENSRLLDHIRDLLEDLGSGLGVTYPVAGEAILEYDASSPQEQGDRPANRHAWSIARYSVKRGHDDAIDALNRSIAEGPGNQLKNLRKMAVVKIGDRAFCLLSEWNSQHDLSAAGPRMMERLERFRDILELVPGGRDIVQTVSGEVAVEFSR